MRWPRARLTSRYAQTTTALPKTHPLIILQADIHVINEETREEVSSWVKNSKLLQEDIIRSKTIANDIVRQSEAPATSGEAIQDAEERVDFLNREVQYSQQLCSVLRGIKHVNSLLDEVEQASSQRRILDSLHLLEGLSAPTLSYDYD
jgi:centromere/kinetochore protein ZW10